MKIHIGRDMNNPCQSNTSIDWAYERARTWIAWAPMRMGGVGAKSTHRC
jgi:hypothetical protein